ncbi:ATP-dependent helicase [Chondromyces apiculatus]|uniref:DNA 3'-5' helicase n=1 Tax=Chondromyces apiculatus DSM 436 TaxID=1192034 RepID=A0A017T391_9BACT|nr:UvrD-helicase domain-containing protein [Chondromyces apiculatus]EYF03006.1 ATP-dependent DNA helicase UvrD/PcrA [Chondromyces apiculatus DSM 436]
MAEQHEHGGQAPGDRPVIPEELNGPQADAVEHVDGPLLIFAGAGSGKTRVIVYRIANLIATHRVPPYRILAVTFTNKAAGEMKHRLERLLGPDIVRDLWVGTFHSVCVRLLRKHHEAAGLDRGFVIYDDGDQRAVVARVLKELDLDDRRYPPRQVLSRIHAYKQEGRGPDDVDSDGYFDDAVLRCYRGYERHLKQASAVDFDDLLLAVLRLVEDPESLAGDDLRRRFSYVLVDEFQDVNHVQYRLVRALCKQHDNLCVVGDDDQSIYRWRGADVRVIRGFRRDFPGASVIKLEQNYRSVANVVQAALGVIRSAKDREPKELWTSNRSGDQVQVVAADSEHDEAAWVASRIKELTAEGVSPRDIAVFYRVHAQSRVLEEVLRSERIPYQIIGGTRFFERAEIKNLLSYLRVVVNPRTDVDLHRIINVPSRKIGSTTIDRLIQVADNLRVSLYDAIEPLVEGAIDDVRAGGKPAVTTQTRKALLGFRDLMEDLRKKAREASPSQVAEEVLERTGYAKLLKEEDNAEADARLQNLQELLQSILDYEEEMKAAGEPALLTGYLERVSLTSDADTLEDVPKVAMMTIHAAKGLEFHAVFLTGMEEDLFPFRSMEPSRGDDVEEERRLAYVAITRAREKLWITHASRRAIFGQTRYNAPSRFLKDMPEAAVRGVLTPATQMMARRPEGSSGGFGSFSGASGAGRFGGRGDRDRAASTRFDTSPRPAWRHPQDSAVSGMRDAAPRPPPQSVNPGERFIDRDPDAESDGESISLRRGSRVRHERFGLGTVNSIDPGADPIASVTFSGWGLKRIKVRFLKPLDG